MANTKSKTKEREQRFPHPFMPWKHQVASEDVALTVLLSPPVKFGGFVLIFVFTYFKQSSLIILDAIC